MAFLTLVLAAFACEAYARFELHVPPNSDRFYEPYLMTGNFSDSPATEPLGSPESWGYEQRGLLYYYTFKDPVTSLAERDFLWNRTLPNAKDIIVLGGSTARGDKATPGHRWWMDLQSKLQRDLSDDSIQIFPMAMSSWVSSQERIALDTFGFPRHPMAVIVLDGANDASDMTELTRPGDPYNMGALYARNYSPIFQVVRGISNVSALVRYFLLKKIQNDRAAEWLEIQGDPSRLKNVYDSSTEVYLDNIKYMARRCDQERVPCFFFLQPMRGTSLSHEHPGSPEIPILAPLYDRFLKALQGTPDLNKGENHFYDATHLFDDKMNLYLDEFHFNDAGQDVLAEFVGKQLLQRREIWYSR